MSATKSRPKPKLKKKSHKQGTHPRQVATVQKGIRGWIGNYKHEGLRLIEEVNGKCVRCNFCEQNYKIYQECDAKTHCNYDKHKKKKKKECKSKKATNVR